MAKVAIAACLLLALLCGAQARSLKSSPSTINYTGQSIPVSGTATKGGVAYTVTGNHLPFLLALGTHG